MKTRGHELLRKKAPKKEDIHQAELARMLGVARSTALRILSGKQPSYEVMLKCRDVLGIPLNAWEE